MVRIRKKSSELSFSPELLKESPRELVLKRRLELKKAEIERLKFALEQLKEKGEKLQEQVEEQRKRKRQLEEEVAQQTAGITKAARLADWNDDNPQAQQWLRREERRLAM